jgi:hypothetical protein
MRDAAKGDHSSVDDFVFYLSVPREEDVQRDDRRGDKGAYGAG